MLRDGVELVQGKGRHEVQRHDMFAGRAVRLRRARFVARTVLKAAGTPWLWPAFRARLPHIKQTLRKFFIGVFQGAGRRGLIAKW
jgi:hypothetical protein